jgi:hypothetical protein
MHGTAQTWRRQGLIWCGDHFSQAIPRQPVLEFPKAAQPFGRIGVTCSPQPAGPVTTKPEELIKMNRMNMTQTIAATPTNGLRVKLSLAAAALVLALLAIPHPGHAQGVVGGMEGGANQGVREGGRAAGPVGAVVGGAVGAGVGGAVGAVNGVLGIGGGYRYRHHHRHHHHYH